MMLELTTRSRRRAARTRRFIVRSASLLLMVIALTFVLPAAVGLSFHAVTDDAMSGTMGKGSAVILDSVPVADLEVGDVITYPITSRTGTTALVTRRIAEIDGGVVRTSGDSAGVLDPWTVLLDRSTQDAVVAHVPYAGYVVDALDGSVRAWSAGTLALLIVTALLSGLLATRRDLLSVASTLSAPAPVGDSVTTGVKVPSPRRTRKTRRGSSV